MNPILLSSLSLATVLTVSRKILEDIQTEEPKTLDNSLVWDIILIVNVAIMWTRREINETPKDQNVRVSIEDLAFQSWKTCVLYGPGHDADTSKNPVEIWDFDLDGSQKEIFYRVATATLMEVFQDAVQVNSREDDEVVH